MDTIRTHNLMPPNLIVLRGKVAIAKNWQEACTDPKKGIPKKSKNQNYGLPCGSANGVIVLDVDNTEKFNEYCQKNEIQLSETFTVKTGKGFHYYFQYPQNGRLYGNKSKKGCGFDIKGMNGYVVAPGGTHPETKKVYEIIKDIPLEPLPKWIKKLYEKDKKPQKVEPLPGVDIETLHISKEKKHDILNGHEKGFRSEKIMGVLNALVYAGLDDPGIFSIFQSYPIGEKFREQRDPEKWLMPQLEKVRSEVTCRAASTWQDRRSQLINTVVDCFNSKYSVVNLSGQALIMDETEKNGEQLLKPSDFRFLRKNEVVNLPTNGDGATKKTEQYDLWINSPNRRQYRKVVFSPGIKTDPDVYNLWRGFEVEPKDGDWSLMENHMFSVLCGGNLQHYEWFLKWCAAVVHHCIDSKKYRRPEVAVVLKGGRGVGKDTFCECFGSFFGRHYACVSQKEHLLGRFNDSLKNCVLCHASETFWAGDKQAEGHLKALITNPQLIFEAKHRNHLMLDSHINLIISSNENWVIPAGPKERRFFVPTLAGKPKDPDYFVNLRKQWNTGGAEAMLYDLMHIVKYSEKDFAIPPVTDELKHQAAMSGSLQVRFWVECLAENIEIPWGQKISSDVIYAKFLAFCDLINQKGRPAKDPFCKDLWEISGLKPKQIRFPDVGNKRGVELPDIKEAKAFFENYMGWSNDPKDL